MNRTQELKLQADFMKESKRYVKLSNLKKKIDMKVIESRNSLNKLASEILK